MLLLIYSNHYFLINSCEIDKKNKTFGFILLNQKFYIHFKFSNF